MLLTETVQPHYRSFPFHLVIKKSGADSRLVIKKSNKARFNPVSSTSCHLVRDILAKVGLDKLENVADKPVEEAEKICHNPDTSQAHVGLHRFVTLKTVVNWLPCSVMGVDSHVN